MKDTNGRVCEFGPHDKLWCRTHDSHKVNFDETATVCEKATVATFSALERIEVVMDTQNPEDRVTARYLEPSRREKHLHYVWYDDQSSGLVHERRIKRA